MRVRRIGQLRVGRLHPNCQRLCHPVSTSYLVAEVISQQGSDTRVIPRNNPPGFWVKPVENKQQKTRTKLNSISVGHVSNKDLFMF